MNTSQISSAEVSAQRNNIVLFVLNHCQSKLPIKTTELTEVVGKNAKLLRACLPAAIETLQDVYGIRMAQVPDSKSGKKYICYSEIFACSPLEYDDDQQRHITLLFLILSLIFMSDRPIYEEDIVKFLKGLKIYMDEEHSFFGANLKKLITETFVRQMYLKKTKSASELDTEVKFLYSWGFRSTMEFTQKRVLETTAKILKTTPSTFTSQYEKAMLEEAANENEDQEAEEEETE